jgi:predicted transcriptional regulator
MREAIAQYVEREEKREARSEKREARSEKREALKHDALRAWEACQVDGLQLTAEDAEAWLAKL